jgi:hypothetical protein
VQLLPGDVAAAEQLLSEVLSKEDVEDSAELDLFLSWEKLSGKPSMFFLLITPLMCKVRDADIRCVMT